MSLALRSAIGLVASLGGYKGFAYPVDGVRNLAAGYGRDMSNLDDDDDWTGTPPEGRHSASRANPGFWAENRTPVSFTAIGVGVALIVLLIVLLL
jgi:hypothetical protein